MSDNPPVTPPPNGPIPPAGATPPPGAFPPPGAVPPPGFTPPIPSADETKGFFGALFDFSFSHFVALKVVKIVYIIYLVLLGLGWLGALIAGFTVNAGIGVIVLIFGPIVAVVYLALFRLGLEFIVAAVRTAENTSILAKRR